jgi:long-chain acyl-CoA synthetase
VRVTWIFASLVSWSAQVAGPRPPGGFGSWTVGIPLPGQKIRIVDPARTELERGLDGEVVVRGPNVLRGYLGHPEESATAIVDGWLHTGDVGHLDADGYLTLVGGSKDMIIRGGANIYPREIEEVLAGDPSVLEAAVIGVPDPKWGEVVVACAETLSGQPLVIMRC